MGDSDEESGKNVNMNNKNGSSPKSYSKTDAAVRESTSANERRRIQQERQVMLLLEEARASGTIILDLSDMGMTSIPSELLELDQLQYLYMAGNALTRLPESFFDCLPNLRWLDLRRNYLASIPSAYIGRHRFLRTLLLESNELRTLPLELGLIPTLNGLNIANNPLEFPPTEVIEKGTQTILAFFRELLRAKSQGMGLDIPRVEDMKLDSDNDSENSPRRRPDVHSQSTPDMYESRQSQYSDLIGPVPQSASLHVKSAQQKKPQRLPSPIKKKPAASHKKTSGASTSNGAGVTPEKVHEKYIEEKKIAKLKNIKEKQESILQKQRDKDQLKAFRDDSRRLQQRKDLEKRIKGGKLEYDGAAEQAPYGVDAEHMTMPTREEVIANEIREKHETIRRALSPSSLAQLEQQRRERDRELEKRIKQHTAAMQERKRRPKGTPQEEMAAAMEELRIVKNMQTDLMLRYQELKSFAN